jgi:hypothetical protein
MLSVRTPKDVALADDGRKLYRDFGITCAGLVELGALARHADAGFDDRYQKFVPGLGSFFLILIL